MQHPVDDHQDSDSETNFPRFDFQRLKIYVYRIEHMQSGLGPFAHDKTNHEVLSKGIVVSEGNSRNLDYGINTPIDTFCSFLNIPKKDIRFAFKNPESLYSFIGDIELLIKHGFVLLRYEIDAAWIVYEEGDIVAYLKSNDPGVLLPYRKRSVAVAELVLNKDTMPDFDVWFPMPPSFYK